LPGIIMMLKKQHLHEILPQRLLVSMPSSHKPAL
jgi:hypothetical protein